MATLISLLADFDAIKSRSDDLRGRGKYEESENLIRSNAPFFMEIIDALRKGACGCPPNGACLKCTPMNGVLCMEPKEAVKSEDIVKILTEGVKVKVEEE